MKSKLFVGSSLLFVGLSACSDPAASGANADAGWLDGGSEGASSRQRSDASRATPDRDTNTAADSEPPVVSSEAGADGGAAHTTTEYVSVVDAGSTPDPSNTTGIDSGSENIGSSDAAVNTQDSGAIETSWPRTDAATVSSDASTTTAHSSQSTGSDETSKPQNPDAGSDESSLEEDASSNSDDNSQTSSIESNTGPGNTSNDSLELVFDASPDARVDSGTNDGPSTGLEAGSLDAGSLDAGSLDAGSLDTGSLDTGSLNTGSLDTGSPDAGSLDAGSIASNETNTSESTDTSSAGESSGTSSDSSTTGETSADVPLTGRQLFEEEQFGGNGRTCLTCHGPISGSISPAEIQALYAADPNDPMFRSIDSNDGVGNDYSLLLERATFRVELALPPGVTLVSDPSATSVVLRRSALSTINTPGLDSTLMWDGRATDLMDQALGAITGHAESSVTPTSEQLALIAEFEQTDAFFSSDTLRNYYDGGPAPEWPQGNTASEQRGRRWFAEDPTNAPRFNICGQCHGGPMTNETQQNSGLPVGEHFQTANVSEFNSKGNPTYTFRFPDPNNPGQTIDVTTPDPGLALTTGDVRDVNFFKIPTLWGISKTAPYFHDNSAATLEELMDHYEDHLATFLFAGFRWPRPHVPTAQDKADIVAYLKLL